MSPHGCIQQKPIADVTAQCDRVQKEIYVGREGRQPVLVRVDRCERIVNALHHFRHRRHEVVVLHVLADEELTFPFDQFTRFRNLEGVADIQTDPKALRASYLEQIRLFLQTIKNGCGRIGADYVAMNTATPFDQALSAYLTRRRTGQG